MQNDNASLTTPDSVRGSNDDDSTTTFQPSAKLRNKLKKLAQWRISPAVVTFPKTGYQFRGGSATVSRAFLDFAFKVEDWNGEPRDTIAEDLDAERQELKSKHLVETSEDKRDCSGGESAEEVYRGEDSVEEQVREPDGVTAGSGKIVAVKMLNTSGDLARVLGSALREAELLVGFGHENIVTLEGFVEDVSKGIIWLLFPWEDNGTLRDFLVSGDWEIPERISLIAGVARGVHYLHSQQPPVCHGDLKSINILVNSEHRAVITDFGSAHLVITEHPSKEKGRDENKPKQSPSLTATFCASDNTITLTGSRYTLRWAAPELLTEEESGLGSDIWAFAWVAYEVMTNFIPFQDTQTDAAVIIRVIQGHLPSITGNARMSPVQALCSLMTECWRIDPRERPTAEDCQKSIGWMPMIIPNTARSPSLLMKLGVMHRRQGDYPNASKFFGEALRSYTDEEDSRGKAHALSEIAQIHRLQGDFSEAVSFYSSALQIHIDTGNKKGRAFVLCGLAEVHRLQNEYDQAFALYSDALQLSTDPNNGQGRAVALRGLAEVHRARKEYSQAATFYSHALQIHTDTGNRNGRAEALRGLAEVHRIRKEYSRAISLYSAALDLFTDIGNPPGRADALKGLAHVHQNRNDYDQALRFYTEALQICTDIGDGQGKADAQRSVARVHRLRKDQGLAVSFYSDALQIRPKRDLLDDLSGRRITSSEIVFIDKKTHGSGTYADVAVATFARIDCGRCERKVAVKKLRFMINSDMTEEKFFRVFVNELRVLDQLSHPNIVELIGFVEDIKSRIAWLVLPWEDNGNLREFLHSGKWEIPERVSLMTDVVLGLEYLHTRQPPICHGDLKSLNILVNSSHRAIITDFGSARRMVPRVTDVEVNPVYPQPLASHAASTEQDECPEFQVTLSHFTLTLTGPGCSLRWAPPEFFNGASLDLPSDIWALGWIGWEAMTDCYPFEGLDLDLDVTTKIIEGQLPRIYDHLDLSQIRSLCNIMQRCWRLDPRQRPSATECRKSIQWIPHAIPATKSDEHVRTGSSTLLLEIGEIHRLQNRHGDASKVFEQGLVIAQSTGDQNTVADLLVRLAHNHREQSRYAEAEAAYIRALAIYTSPRSDGGLEITATGREHVQSPLFRLVEGEMSDTQALTSQKRFGDDREVGIDRVLLDLEQVQEEGTELMSFGGEAPAINKRSGDDISQAGTLDEPKNGHVQQMPSLHVKAQAAFSLPVAMYTSQEKDALPMTGNVQVQGSKYVEAEASYVKALSAHASIGDDRGPEDVSPGLKMTHGGCSHRLKPDASCPQPSDTCLGCRNYGGWADALEGLGHVQRARSQFVDAEDSYMKAFAIYRIIEHDLGQANALLDLGHAQRAQAKHSQAEASFGQALAIYQSLGHDLGRANVFDGLGHIQRTCSKHEEAEESFNQALTIYESIGNDLGRANALIGLGHVQRERFKYVQAEASLTQSLLIYNHIGNERGQANALLGIGHIQGDHCECIEAEVSYKKALTICKRIGDDLGRARALNGLGHVQRLLSKYTEAEGSYTEALDLQKSIGDDLGQASTLGGLGSVQRKISKDVEAEVSFRESLVLYTKMGSDLGRANSSLELAEILLQQKRYAEAKILIGDAVEISDQIGYNWAKITARELLEKVSEVERSFTQPSPLADTNTIHA